jgi:hypothetical protein
MRKLVFTTALAVLSLGLSAGVWAGTAARIVGTSKNDVLKGTPRADALSGLAGNDTLQGLAGNDVLSGGPGNDKLAGGRGRDQLRCGAGRDTAVADATDNVGSDCEVVKGLPAPPPPEPPAPPPPPPPPATPQAVAGHYCGFTNQGKSICFDVEPGSARVGNFETTSDVDCGQFGFTVGLGFSGPTAMQPDLTFTYAYNGGLQSGDSDITNITTSYTVNGELDTAGNATGSLNLSRLSFDFQGTHIDCGAAPYAWQARVGA